MEVIGKIIMALPEVSGTSKAGNPWKKKEYVLETLETYPKKIHFDFFGERAEQFPLQVGQTIKLSFDIESREYNGRWYTQIRGWKAEDPSVGTAAPAQPGYAAPAQPGYAAPAQPYAAPAAPAPYPGAPAAYPAPATGAVPPPPAMPAPDSTDDLPF